MNFYEWHANYFENAVHIIGSIQTARSNLMSPMKSQLIKAENTCVLHRSNSLNKENSVTLKLDKQQGSIMDCTVKLEDYISNSQGSGHNIVPMVPCRKSHSGISSATDSKSPMTPNVNGNEPSFGNMTPVSEAKSAPVVSEVRSTPDETANRNSRNCITNNENNAFVINTNSQPRSQIPPVKPYVKKSVTDIRTSTPLADITTATRTACGRITSAVHSTVWMTPAESPVSSRKSPSRPAVER